MELLNNIDLAWLYVLYKLGSAAGVLMAFFALMIIISGIALVNAISEGNDEGNAAVTKCALRVVIPSLVFFVLSAAVVVVSPSLDELKAVAVYKVSHEAVTSEVSQKLIDALIHFLNKQ